MELFSTNKTHRITRYERVYADKNEALDLLKENLRPYGELVSIRYYDGVIIKLLLVFYEEKGFKILYPSSNTIYQMSSKSSDLTFKETISRYFENSKEVPEEGHIAIIDLSNVFIYSRGTWISMGKSEESNIIDCGFLKDL